MRTCNLFMVMLIFSAVAFAGPEVFKPDFKNSDIYIQHLKRTPLSGWWKIKRATSDRKNTPDDEGMRNKFYAVDYDDSGWQEDIVPNWLSVPFRKEYKDQSWGGMISSIPQEIREWGGVAYFRKNFMGPKKKDDERAILHFEEVAGAFTVFINGKKVGEEIPYSEFNGAYRGPQKVYDIDITDVYIPGQVNNVTIRLYHSGQPLRWCWAAKAGILDMVSLDIRPRAYTGNILVTPMKNLRDVEFDCIVSGSQKYSDTSGWKGEVFEWKSGKKVAAVNFGELKKSDGLNMISGKVTLSNPKLWSPESPFLYGVRVKNGKGQVAGVQRFGMRTFGVEKSNFVLNGKPIMLRGITAHGHPIYNYFKHGWLFALRTDYAGACKKYWKFYRDANINHIRWHSHTMSRPNLDILDELGIIVTYELYCTKKMLTNPTRADKIDVKDFSRTCDKDGNLYPEYVQGLKDRLRQCYSHPSICTHSFGNEICDGYDDKQLISALNNTYDLYRKIDRQNRPCTNSSGRAAPEVTWRFMDMSKNEKLDYLDMHDYSGSLRHTPLFYAGEVFKDYLGKARKAWGEDHPPIMNGETIYYSEHYYAKAYDPIWDSEDADEPDWEAADFVFNGAFRRKEVMAANLSYYWCRNWGTRTYKYNRTHSRAVSLERILGNQRKLWPDQDGFEALTAIMVMPRAYPFEDIEFKRDEDWRAMKKVCNPFIAVFDRIAPNKFSAEPVRSQVTVINNSEKDAENIRFEFDITNSSGKVASKGDSFIGKLASGEKKVIPFEAVVEMEGPATLTHRILTGKRILNERSQYLTLRKREKLFAPIKTHKTIAVYDASEVFGGLKPSSTLKLLGSLGVAYTQIGSFENLACDILVIGSNSIDAKVEEQGDKIRRFVENGGRLLVFEQNFAGRIPFITELEYAIAGTVEFTEILKKNHPLAKGFQQENMFCWNSKDGSVYRNFITPVSRAAVTTGANTTVWGANGFGMTSAHLRLGEGDILFSQLEVTPIFETDSAAIQFARNCIEIMLDDSTRADATEFKGYARLKALPLSQSKSLPISLKDVANMGFADKKANDGKGGWSDQGETNDLSAFPAGDKMFGGIPFEIVDPAANGNRSCVVVARREGCKLPAESKAIDVNAKVKRLLFMHAGAWTPDKGEAMGEYVVTYESGRIVEIPLVSGESIDDWWTAPSKKPSNADCVWSTINRSGIVGVFLYEWKNPHAGDKIKSIRLKALSGVIGLAGMTGEKF